MEAFSPDTFGTPANKAHGRTERLKRIAFWSIIISGLVSAVVLGISYFHTRNVSPLGEALIISPSAQPIFAIGTYDTGAKTLVPIAVESAGTAMVIDAVQTKDAALYLIANPDGTSSNIYLGDREDSARGLSQETFSDTLKLNLSYDEQSGRTAFASITTGSSSDIMMLESGTTTERKLSEGNRPVLLKDGFYLVYDREGVLYSADASTGTEYELLTLPEGSVYAVDPLESHVALYDAATQTIQYFSLAGYTGASYEKSEPATGAPAFMALSGGSLLEVIGGAGGWDFYKNGVKITTALSGVLPPNARISFTHD